MEAQISLDGSQHAGVVTAISPEVRSGQVTGRVKFAGTQPPGLRQSQRGSVRIVIEQRALATQFERSADIVPATRAVYVVDGDRAVADDEQHAALRLERIAREDHEVGVLARLERADARVQVEHLRAVRREHVGRVSRPSRQPELVVGRNHRRRIE